MGFLAEEFSITKSDLDGVWRAATTDEIVRAPVFVPDGTRNAFGMLRLARPTAEQMREAVARSWTERLTAYEVTDRRRVRVPGWWLDG